MSETMLKRLQAKIIAVTLIVGVAPLLLLSVVFYRQFSDICEERMIAQTAHAVKTHADALNTALRDNVSMLQAVSGAAAAESLLDRRFLASTVAALNRTATHPGVIALAVLDSDGTLLADSSPFPTAPEADRSRGIAQAVLYDSSASAVFADSTGNSHYFMTIRGSGANAHLFLHAAFDGDLVYRLLCQLRDGRSQDIYLLDRQGVFQTKPWYDGALLTRGFLDVADFNESGPTVQKVVRDGKTFYYAGAWLSENDWLLVVRQPSCQDMGRLAQARDAAMISVLLGFATIFFVSLAVTHIMVSRLKKALTQAQALSLQLGQNEKLAAIGKMAAGVAHEVNNPLAIIREKTGWMKDLLDGESFKGSPYYQKYRGSLTTIEKAVSRAAKITHNLLSYAGSLEPRNDDVDVNAVINKTIDILEQHARLHHVEIQTDLEEHLPVISSSESELQQVFLNLLNNAVDAIGTDGLIDISTRRAGDRIVVQIKDDGAGMAPEAQRRIFEPFYSTKAAVYGTGLGLAISHSIITNMNGTIAVASAEGRGTTMTVTLPVTGPVST